MEPEKQNKLSLPIAIAFAGIVIAGALMYGKVDTSAIRAASNQANQAAQAGQATGGESLEKMRPISNDDHIRGSLDADVTIVEYSDTECPFCKQFHSTLEQIIKDYDGKVAWVYRHYPLDQLHPKARNEASALECANELGGNDKFWAYVDRIYSITPSNNGLDPAELPKIAEYVGLDVSKFNDCLSSNKYADKIQKDEDNAFTTGGNGTPWSIVVSKSGKKYELSGAQPYASVKQIIDTALANN